LLALRQNDPVLFTEAGKVVDELRTAGCARIATSKPSLVVEWFMAARCAIEKLVEARRVHNSPPSTSPVSRFPVLNCMRSLSVAPLEPVSVVSLRGLHFYQID
jgi:hypothetical protein